MKKIALFVISIVSLAIVSCNESIIDVDDIKDVIGNDNTTFTVSMPETKTTLDGTFVKWAAGDKIRVYGYTEGQAVVSKDYTLKSGEGTRSAIFENTSDPIGDYDQYFAIYPAIEKFNLNTSSLPSKLEIGSSFTLTGQAAVENGFDPDFALMLAQADANKKLVFKYGMGFIKITIPVDNVTEVSISSDKSWTCRRPEYNADGSFSKANSGTSEVSSVGSFIKDSSYYLLAPAREANFGTMTVTYTINGTQESFTGSVPSSIVNGEIFDLGSPWVDRSPSINLNNTGVNRDQVNIAYDANGGSINYTLVYDDGGTVTAALDTDQTNTIANLSFSNPGSTTSITFSCDERTAGDVDAATERVAHVILTYAKEGRSSITKNVTITQAAYNSTTAEITTTKWLYYDGSTLVKDECFTYPSGNFSLSDDASGSGCGAASFTIEEKTITKAFKLSTGSSATVTTPSDLISGSITFYFASRKSSYLTAANGNLIIVKEGDTVIETRDYTAFTFGEYSSITLNDISAGTVYTITAGNKEHGLLLVKYVETVPEP